MTYNIESFKQSHEKYSLYHFNCESNNILAKLSYLTYDQINRYHDVCFDLDIGLSYHADDIIHFHIWINGKLIDSSIRTKSHGSDIRCLLKELVDNRACTLEEKS
jgi:hypothetical protein